MGTKFRCQPSTNSDEVFSMHDNPSRPKKVLGRKRFGGVAVEFAMVAPIFFLVLFGGIEFASIHVTQCAIENAAFEGVRHGIVPGATADGCKERAEAILDATRIKVYDVTVVPGIIEPSTPEVSVTVTVPMTPENKFGLAAFLRGGDLVKTITLPREDSSVN